MTAALDRRQFLGLALASVGLLAAGCGGDGGLGEAGGPTTPTTVEGGAPSSADLVILRTASSVERLVIDVYTTALDAGLFRNAVVADAARLFRDQHRQHAELFESTTTKLGGQPFTKPNPAVLATLDARIKGLREESEAVQLVHDLEATAAETYLAVVGGFNDRSLNKTAMAVGAMEARHVAVLAGVLSTTFATRTEQVPPDGVLKKNRAVAAGTGVS